MKKGFTLVELLAVIVILAVISLITTPMILNVIETARKGAAKSSALGYIDAIENQIIFNELDNSNIKITNGLHKLPIESISIKGEVPSDGWILVDNNQIISYAMKMMNYIIIDGEEITADVEIPSAPICKRATTLHTEVCEQIDDLYYCSATYETGATIEYGTLGTMGENLQSGDALDCDVNDDGIYNSETERFYYISGLDGNEESDIAVLVYYNNISVDEDGQTRPDNTKSSLSAYDASGQNWHGPTTAITNLPTSLQWSNARLSNPIRMITTETGESSTQGGILPTDFSYEGYVARLLTVQELNLACDINVGRASSGELDNCNYLMENTQYSSSTVGSLGYWLENPRKERTSNAWLLSCYGRSVVDDHIGYSHDKYAVRPVIEVPISKILY